MTVVSYRFYCDECSNEEVIRESEMDDSLWSIRSKNQHSGICPECNDMVSVDDIEDARESREDDDEEVEFEEVDGVGASTAGALRRKGIHTRGDVRLASDAKLLTVDGLGKSKIDALREHVS